MAAGTVGPYGDSADDFVHLDKVAVRLRLSWENDDGDDFFTRDDIELSRFDSLFARLTRRAPFPTWSRLTVMPVRFQLYNYEGAAWFARDHDGICSDVRDRVQQFQARLHQNPPPEPPILVLEVD